LSGELVAETEEARDERINAEIQRRIKENRF
jgi:hypothetical protein